MHIRLDKWKKLILMGSIGCGWMMFFLGVFCKSEVFLFGKDLVQRAPLCGEPPESWWGGGVLGEG